MVPAHLVVPEKGPLNGYVLLLNTHTHTHTHTHLMALCPGLSSSSSSAGTRKVQEAQLSPRDRAMRRVN